MPVEPGEDVLDQMREAVADRMHVELSAVAADGFRTVAARAWSGGVSLIEGGAWVGPGEWQRGLSELTAALRANADLLAYGYIRRGWAVEQARFGTELAYDWPPRPEGQPRGIGFTQEAFEDVYAPDAFAVQLLGPGYAGRAPEGAAWRRERVGTASQLIEHSDPSAWFDAPFVPFRDRMWTTGEHRPPRVLEQARKNLAPVLYRPGVLSVAGYPDAEAGNGSTRSGRPL